MQSEPNSDTSQQTGTIQRLITWRDVLLALVLSATVVVAAVLFGHADRPEDKSGAHKNTQSPGFTLIEMAIVLVIIGLIVGGVLVGQDLIRAAAVRAQISQIEKYNQAVNTFYGKYQALPGDMNLVSAQNFGFATLYCNGVTMGYRDGNGLIDGPWASLSLSITGALGGENVLIWSDLSTAGLIDGQFPNSGAAAPAACTEPPADGTPGLSSVPGPTFIGDYLPPAKIGNNNYVTVYETGGFNWYSVQGILSTNWGGSITSSMNLSVAQAYQIDKKVDDGGPTTGNVVAVYISVNSPTDAPNTATSGGTATSCYDTTTNTYSITQSGGAGINCALSFRFQ